MYVESGANISFLLTGDAMQEHVKRSLKLLPAVSAGSLFLFPTAVLMFLQLVHI